MKIPALDISDEMKMLWEEIQTSVLDVLRSGKFVLGPVVEAFENEIAKYLGVKHAIGVNSGTDALIISLRSLGVQPGDQVITTPFTFVATVEAIRLVGAEPVFVDIESDTYNLDPALIESKLTSRTKVILPVHLYGHSADMDPILNQAKQHGLKILEDVAQASGGSYKSKKLGALGDAGAFSFYPSKNLGACGDGGMIATNDDQVARTARMLRDHGCEIKYQYEMIGYNSRLDAIQAAILRTKLPYLNRWNEMRRKAADRYEELLNPIQSIRTPLERPDSKHVYHQYTVSLPADKRDLVRSKMSEEGIGAMVYYPEPLHKLPLFESEQEHLPQAELAARSVLSLPIWPTISPEAQKSVTEALVRSLD